MNGTLRVGRGGASGVEVAGSQHRQPQVLELPHPLDFRNPGVMVGNALLDALLPLLGRFAGHREAHIPVAQEGHGAHHQAGLAGGVFAALIGPQLVIHTKDLLPPYLFAASYLGQSACALLAAIVLGGMGTVLGVLIGATLLKLLPEKLRFVNEYRLLIFGLLLVLMMRFRPEGLIANQRRQLEFHEDDEELAERIDEEVHETGRIKEATS